MMKSFLFNLALRFLYPGCAPPNPKNLRTDLSVGRHPISRYTVSIGRRNIGAGRHRDRGQTHSRPQSLLLG
eukprot:769629-Rhodomonas_salina.2